MVERSCETTESDPFARRLEHVGKELRTNFKKREVTTDTLYHYTKPEALIEILLKRTLWATKIRDFADKTELLYADTVLRRLLNEIANTSAGSTSAILAEACLTRDIWLNKVLDIYVACFSTNAKLLHQWKNYANGGAGFSIGFDAHKINDLEESCLLVSRIYLAKVCYSEAEQRSELKAIFNSYLEEVLDAKCDDQIDSCANAIMNSVALHASLFKHPDFEPEDECRLIIERLPGASSDAIVSNVCFRILADKVVPYVKVKFTENVIKSIYIGPGMEQDACERNLQYLVDLNKDLEGAKVLSCEGFSFSYKHPVYGRVTAGNGL